MALSPETKAPVQLAPHRLLKKSQILALQKALAQERYYKRRLNGVFNPATQRALRRFQHDHILPVTGEPDEATLERLGLAW